MDKMKYQEANPGALMARILLLILVSAYVGYFTWLSLDRWDALLCSLDYARIDSAAHNTAIGKFMWSNEAHFNYWKQHIAPILLFFSAMYTVTDAYWPTFFIQTFTIGAGAVPLFFIARHFLKNEYLALLCAVAYLSTGSLQVANLYDYHMLSHEGFFLFCAFYAMLKKRWGWYAISLGMMVILKEDAFILASMVALYAAFGEREFKKAFYTWLALGLYALVLFKVAYPFVRGGGDYEYSSYYMWLGDGPFGIAWNFITKPMEMLHTLLSNDYRSDKWLAFVIQHGAILPLLSPLGFIMLLPPSMELFLANYHDLYGLTHHYPLLVVPVWSLAVVLGLANVKRAFESAFRENDRNRVSIPEKVLRYLLLAIIYVYAVTLLYYSFYGGFDFTILGVRARMDSATKPSMILALSAFMFFVFTPPRPLTGLLGIHPATRAVAVALLCIISVKLYYVADYGALPVYSSWSKYMATVDKKHAKRVRKAIALIPRGARVISNQGVFAHLHHHTEAYVSLPGYRPSLTEKKIEYLLLDIKDTQGFGRHQAYIIDVLLRSRPYGVLYYDDKTFIFKKGYDKHLDHKLFMDVFTTSTVNGYPSALAHAVGDVTQDSTSPFGLSLKANKNKTAEGHLVYGPYIRLAPGKYTALFRMKVGELTDREVARIDVVSDLGKTTFAQATVTGADFKQANIWRVFRLNFEIKEKPVDRIELRILYKKGADLAADMTRIEMSYDTYTKTLAEKEWLDE